MQRDCLPGLYRPQAYLVMRRDCDSGVVRPVPEAVTEIVQVVDYRWLLISNPRLYHTHHNIDFLCMLIIPSRFAGGENFQPPREKVIYYGGVTTAI